MAKPGLIIMAIVCLAVSLASCGGRRELFAPERAEAQKAAA